MRHIRIVAVAVVALVLTSAGAGSATARSGLEKVTICHHAGPTKQFEIEVAAAAVPGHLRHGDSIGECGGGVPF